MPPQSPSLVSASAQGAKFLILLQVASRLLTFAVNQLLLRFLTPAQLGLSVQLELFTISILYFSRESLRNALQRQRGLEDGVKEDGVSQTTQDGEKDLLVEGTPAAAAQTVVNISMLTFPLGIVFSVILGSVYAGFMASPEAVSQPYFNLSVLLYVVGTILELLSEPGFAVVQQLMMYKVRASAEWKAAFARCIVTFAVTACASWAGMDLGPIPFALGQVMYGAMMAMVYMKHMSLLSAKLGFSLGLRKIRGTKVEYLKEYFQKDLLSLAITMWFQSAIKHILTQGDSLLVAWLTTIHDQGIYALAANYGSLIARMLFQPLEESARNLFAKLLAPANSSDKAAATSGINSALRILKIMLRLYSLLSILAVSVGPPFAPLGLSLIAGRRWLDSAAGETLGAYCYYIPLLAANGMTEAFVQAVATPKQLQQQSVWMLFFSVGFGVGGVVFVKTLGWGAQGLVWANVVNMMLRICWSTMFIEKWFKEKGVGVGWRDVFPGWKAMAVAGAAAAISRGMGQEGKGLLLVLAQAGLLAGGLVGAVGVFERGFLIDVWSTVQNEGS